MLLIAREELILAVVEGSVVFWGGVILAAGLYHMTAEAIEYTMGEYRRRKRERLLTRILEGKR